MKRAPTSASNLWRRRYCPGSHHAEAGAPEEQTPFSKEGVLLHYRDAMSEDGDTPSQDYVLLRNKQLREGQLARIRAENGIPDDYEPFVLKEEADGTQPECCVYNEQGEPIIPGHPDWVHWYPDYGVLSVSDNKFGRKKVTAAEDNDQLKCYCVACADPVYGDFRDAKKIYGTITQPWAYPPVHSVLYTPDQIVAAKAELIQVYENCQSPDAPRIAGLEWCWQCKARSHCPECVEMRENLAALKISEIPIPQLEAMAPRVKTVERHCEAYWERLLYIATEFPHLLDKYELVSGVKRAHISDVIGAHQRLVDAGLMTSHQFCECTKVAIGKLVETVAVNMRYTEKEARLAVEQALFGYIELKEGKPRLEERKIIQLNP